MEREMKLMMMEEMVAPPVPVELTLKDEEEEALPVPVVFPNFLLLERMKLESVLSMGERKKLGIKGKEKWALPVFDEVESVLSKFPTFGIWGRMRLAVKANEKGAPMVFEEVRSVVYIVGQLDYSSKFSAAIFKIELGRNGEILGDATKAKDRIAGVFDQKKYFDSEPPAPCLSNVACDRVDELLCLVCSYSRLGCYGGTFQAPVCVFNTLTEELIELPESPTLAPKPFPLVMAVGKNLYVYGQCMSTSVKVPQPTLELFDPMTCQWESSSSSSVQLCTPQFELLRSMDVEGYAVVKNFLVISVVDANGGCARNEFLYCKLSGFNSSNKWEKLIVSEDTRRYPFSGKAEFVNDVIFSYSRDGLVAYRVDWCSGGEEEGVLVISPPLVVGFPEFAALPVEWYDSDSFCFAYMGFEQRFCIIQTGDELSIPDEQYVAISVVEVSNDLSSLTTLASSVLPLNIRGLSSELFLTSCFVR